MTTKDSEKYKKLEETNFSKFDNNKKKYKDGVFTLQLTSWDEFHSVVKIFNNDPNYFWRGQKSNDSLKSSFYRDDNYKKVGLDKIFSKLKQKLADTGINVDKLSPNEIWASGQRYGLKTPLLDWTESPYIAAYFAFYKRRDGRTKSSGDGRVAIYAVNRIIKRLIQKKKKCKKGSIIKGTFYRISFTK